MLLSALKKRGTFVCHYSSEKMKDLNKLNEPLRGFLNQLVTPVIRVRPLYVLTTPYKTVPVTVLKAPTVRLRHQAPKTSLFRVKHFLHQTKEDQALDQSWQKLVAVISVMSRVLIKPHYWPNYFPHCGEGVSHLHRGALILAVIKSTRLVANANPPEGISAFPVLPYHVN